MTTTTIFFTIAGAILIAVMVVGMMISQSKHKALAAKNNQLRMLNQQQRRLQNLLRSLPENYLSPELRDFLYQAILNNLKSFISLQPEKSAMLKEEYDTLSREREQMKANPPKGSNQLLSADQTSAYRGLLKSLYEFIRRNYQTGRLTKEHAEKMIKQVELKLVETAIDFFTTTAKDLIAQNKAPQARNVYQKALDTIEKSPHSAQFKQDGMKIRAEMEKATEAIRAIREQRAEAESAKLADQMESLANEEESWKKRQTYD